jgi:hypothetical protein
MTEHLLDRQIAEEAGRRRQHAGIRLPAALIAATAPVHGLTVHTRNVTDFKGSATGTSSPVGRSGVVIVMATTPGSSEGAGPARSP